MNFWPLRFRKSVGAYLFSDDAGGFFRADEGFLERYVSDDLTPLDADFLRRGGHSFGEAGDLAHTAFAYRWSQRQAARPELSYVILVPTNADQGCNRIVELLGEICLLIECRGEVRHQ